MAAAGAKQAFGGIDILRFLAAISVALFHYGFWVWAFPQGIAGRAAAVPPQPTLGNVFSWGWIGVDVFFVISGFVIAFSAENAAPWKFVSARFKRLVPAVIVCAPLTAGILVLMDIYSGKAAALLTARTIAFVPLAPWVDSVYWTLGIEVAFYSLVWGLLLLGRSHWIEPSVVAIGLLSSTFWAAFFPLALDRYAETRMLSLLLVHHGCFFAIGVLLWAVRTKAASGKRITLLVLFNLAGLVQIASASDVIDEKVGIETSIVAPLLAYLSAIALVIASLWARLSWIGWRKIGLATYPLYLIHDAAGAASIGLLHRAGMPYLAAATVTLALAIAFSCLVAWKMEPILRGWLDRVLSRRKPLDHPQPGV